MILVTKTSDQARTEGTHSLYLYNSYLSPACVCVYVYVFYCLFLLRCFTSNFLVPRRNEHYCTVMYCHTISATLVLITIMYNVVPRRCCTSSSIIHQRHPREEVATNLVATRRLRQPYPLSLFFFPSLFQLLRNPWGFRHSIA